MRKFLFAVLACTTLAWPAAAQTAIDDPLHGYDAALGPTVNIDGGSISPINPVDPFGFYVSPGNNPQTGTLYLAVLIPTNDISVTSYSVTGNMPGVTGTSLGVWNTGRLETFINAASGSTVLTSVSPQEPIGAFTTGQDTADPSVTGFNVYLANLGTQTLLKSSASIMSDAIAGLPAGTLIVAYLAQGDSTIGTANSGVLMQQASPVPAPPIGAGLPGMLAAAFGLWYVNRSRRKIDNLL